MARGKIPQELLQKIRDSVNLLEVVGERVVLRKSGANYTGLCPFHSERTPSFSVSEQKQVYYCYGCQKGGDLFSFVQEIQGIGFGEAVEELAERARIALPKDWGVDDGSDPAVAKRRAEAREKLSLAWRVNLFVKSFYQSELSRQPHVREYYRNRGVDEQMAKNFYVGAAPASWDALASHLVAKKAPLPLATELGLIRPSTNAKPGGPGYFDLFRNRAMFPIVDMRGKVAGFGGRALPLPEGAPDVGGESPKYLNSPESPLFQKGKLAFGLFQAQKNIREKNEVVLVEGYFDVLALHAAGFDQTVAACGTSLTPDHLNIFRRLCDKVTLLFDGDKAGVAAMERAMEVGLQQGIVLYGATMPEGLDPDEVLFDQEDGSLKDGGREQMREILAAAKPILDERIRVAVEEAARGPEALAQAVKRVSAWLLMLSDPVGREVRLESVSKQLGVSRELLMGGVKQGKSFNSRPAPAVVRSRPAVPNPPLALPKREKILLGALARFSRFTQFLVEAGGNLPPNSGFSDLFEFPAARAMVAAYFENEAQSEIFEKNPGSVMDGQLDSQLRSILTEAAMGAEPMFGETELKVALGQAIGRAWARFSQQIKKALAEAEAKKDAGLQAKLMKEYLDVQRKMKEFTCFYDEA